MSETAIPILSPGFERARRLSAALSVILTIAFWLMALLLIAAPAVLLLPRALIFNYDGLAVHVAQGDLGGRALVALAVVLFAVPLLFVLHHARTVFANFRDGAVFAEHTIARIREAAVWLIVAAIATTAGENLLDFASGLRPPYSDLKFSWLIFGAVAYVAAYVMAEGRRMANENASFL
jgi:hypothetical protein